MTKFHFVYKSGRWVYIYGDGYTPIFVSSGGEEFQMDSDGTWAYQCPGGWPGLLLSEGGDKFDEMVNSLITGGSEGADREFAGLEFDLEWEEEEEMELEEALREPDDDTREDKEGKKL